MNGEKDIYLDKDGYPDVTLAEPNHYSNIATKDTIVSLQQPKTGCYANKCKIVIICVILVIILSIALLLFFYFGIRLPRSIIPSNYELEIKVDLTNFEFKGSVNISISVNETTKYVIFHRSRIQIIENSIRIIPRLDVAHPRIKRQFIPPNTEYHVLELEQEIWKGSQYVLQVGEYEGNIKANLRGLYRSSFKTKDGLKRYLASSQLQSTEARSVFPCFDEPDFKATFNVIIIHQPGYEALSNMPLQKSSVLNNGWLRKEFSQTPIMSTYILAFVVADFKSRTYTFKSGYTLKIWAQPDAYSQTEYALDFTVKAYDFFTEYFGIRDVIPKADHVAVPDFYAGAMENWGLVIYRETALLFDPQVSSSKNKYTVTLIMAHEIAHTWFGNMVTMKWWDDLWLNEGFASILMYFGMNAVYPEWNVLATQVVEDMFPVMEKDALSTSHSVSTDVKDPNDIQQFFDMISYNKGMSILRMLGSFIGLDNFRKGLQMYVKRYKFKNAARDQLWQTFTEAVNHTYVIKPIMDTWTRQMGYPVVDVILSDGVYVLNQKRFLFGTDDSKEPNPFGYKWYIPFTYVTQDSPHKKHQVWLNLGSANIPKSKGWLLGNYDFTGFYRVNYEGDMWKQLAQQLVNDHTVFLETNRAGLIGDAFALARANLLDYSMALNMTVYLKSEQSYIPWRAFLDSVKFLNGMIANTAAYGKLQKYLSDLVAPVFERVDASDRGDLPERYLRQIILTMACEVGVEKTVIYAKSMFNAWKKFSTRLPTDFAMIIYSVGVREGGAEEWDFVWNKSQVTNVASERAMMMEALAQSQKPWLLWRYITWVFDPEKINRQDVRLVFGYYVKNPLSRMVALDFVLSKWQDLNRRFPNDMPEIITEVTTYINTEFKLKQLETLIAEYPPKAALKAAANAVALIRSNIEWMNNHYQTTTEWLENRINMEEEQTV
ncbi:hypothetical protein LOTGIDRAFT_174264 [Lottia gigantea]|uniref:Aminopeptidase n=1 Tax=Lottia gigantea TaxID=225164 RepID=V4AU50_LOTGI|nr:hypothetical protein LOTGIDRAFT_174264 [Lottia gigantea]ESO98455.1 hypothetical protein LOTGIDRAFT_174264 [Lottia gigantea]